MDESQVKSKMQQVIDLVTRDIGGVRTGRATPALVEELIVPVYGGTQKLKVVELATITSPDPQTLIIDPWDKSIIGEIKHGILSSNIGLNPSLDDQIIRIILPPLTSEDRERYVKLLSVKLENGRIMIRQIRADMMHSIKKSFEGKETSEDEKFRLEKHLQEITDEFIGKIEEIGEKKKLELLQI